MRRGERAGDHGGGGELADALDRDPLLAAPGSNTAASLAGLRPAGAARRGGVDVGAGDDAVRPGAGDRGEVDAEVLGELAHRRLGQRPSRPRPWATPRGPRRRRSACGRLAADLEPPWRTGSVAGVGRGGSAPGRRAGRRRLGPADQDGAASARPPPTDRLARGPGRSRPADGAADRPRGRRSGRRPVAASAGRRTARPVPAPGGGAGSVSIAMIGVPTSTVVPASKSSSTTSPAYWPGARRRPWPSRPRRSAG